MPHIDVNTRQARHHLQLLVSFLGGEAEVRKQVERVQHMFEAEKSNVGYTKYWLEPRTRWWLGLRDVLEIDRKAESFRHRVRGNVAVAHETAVKIARLYAGMPEFKRKEFRQRLLAEVDPTPTLLEINTAAHYQSACFRIDWCEPGPEGVRTCEFVAVGDAYPIEVECKAKTIDAGRRLERPAFYRLYDELVPMLAEVGATGWIDVILDGAMPVARGWLREVRDHVADRSTWDGRSGVLSDGKTSVAVALTAGNPVQVPPKDLSIEAARLNEEFAHVGVFASRGDADLAVNPVFIRARSKKLDRVLHSIHKDLRSKKDQFSGDRAGVVCCYLPEIDTFDGLEQGPLANMTLDFFTKHAPAYVAGVSYLADSQVVPQPVPGGVAFEGTAPSLDFRNPHFDEAKYGPVRMLGAEG